MRKTVYLVVILTFLFSGLNADTKSNEKYTSRWEISGGAGLNFTSMEMNFTNSYSPSTHLNTVHPTSTYTNQVIKAIGENNTKLGFFIGLNYLFSKTVGIQLLSVFHSDNLSAEENTVNSTLTGTWYSLIDETYYPLYRNQEFDWTYETTGEYNYNTLSLNLLYRIYLSKDISMDLSGGATLFRVSGQITPLVHDVWTEDKASIYPFPCKLIMGIEPTFIIGGNVGVELNIPLFKHLGFVFTFRYFLSLNGSAETQILDFADTLSGENPDYLEQIKSEMNLESITINPSFLTFSGGLKVRF